MSAEIAKAKLNDQSSWVIHSPETVSYFPSEEAIKRRSFSESEIKLDINSKSTFKNYIS